MRDEHVRSVEMNSAVRNHQLPFNVFVPNSKPLCIKQRVMCASQPVLFNYCEQGTLSAASAHSSDEHSLPLLSEPLESAKTTVCHSLINIIGQTALRLL